MWVNEMLCVMSSSACALSNTALLDVTLKCSEWETAFVVHGVHFILGKIYVEKSKAGI